MTVWQRVHSQSSGASLNTHRARSARKPRPTTTLRFHTDTARHSSRRACDAVNAVINARASRRRTAHARSCRTASTQCRRTQCCSDSTSSSRSSITARMTTRQPCSALVCSRELYVARADFTTARAFRDTAVARRNARNAARRSAAAACSASWPWYSSLAASARGMHRQRRRPNRSREWRWMTRPRARQVLQNRA